MRKFVGQAYGSGCGRGEKVTLCVEANDRDGALGLMEAIMMSRYPSHSVDRIREATEEESRTLSVDHLPENMI